MKAINWHKNNMDIIAEETVSDPKFKYIYAISVALIYILDWIRKNEKNLKSK